MIEGASKLKKIITLCGRPSPGLTIKFHDFSGLENNIVKFHDFLQVFHDMYRSTHANSNLAAVVQKLDNAIQGRNHYLVDSAIGSPNTYPLVSDLSDG